MTMGRVAGKTAIVTGGAAGIGRACAPALAREGARVAVADVDEAGGADTASAIGTDGGEAFFRRADVGVTADMRELVRAAADRWGRLDVLVNNAGVAIPGSVTDISEEDWERVLNVNLSGMWRGMRFAIPEMLKTGGGSVINTSSVQSLVGFRGWAGYAASKGGINGLTRQVAVDYAAQGLRVEEVQRRGIDRHVDGVPLLDLAVGAEPRDENALLRAGVLLKRGQRVVAQVGGQFPGVFSDDRGGVHGEVDEDLVPHVLAEVDHGPHAPVGGSSRLQRRVSERLRPDAHHHWLT